MYLKRLELIGFKSFAEKTVLEVGPGLTAVVGPNGSGKSNISDAIRWVLGEVSARQIRGTKMEDVIFAGSEGRKPTGYAQVSITLDNSDRTLPLDFAEVQITRRVDRGGESEYLINQVPCRLKDVQDLFLDTGIGKENYSVVGQGRVDEILSSKPEDRRSLFEEAAGIARYKARKKEATRRLDETEQNLLRIGDIISELETQMEGLAESARRAEIYQEVQGELKDLDVGLLAAGLTTAGSALAARTARIARAQHELVELTDRLERVETALETTRQLAAAKDLEAQSAQGFVLEATTRLERAEARTALARQQLHTAAGEVERLTGEAQQLERRLAVLVAEAAAAEAERAAQSGAAAVAAAELTAAEAAGTAGAAQVAQAQADLEAARRREVELLQGIAARRSGLSAAARAQEAGSERLARVTAAAAQAAAERAAIAARGRTQAERVAALDQERQSRVAAVGAAQQRLREAEATMQRAAGEGGAVREKLEAARARLALLEEMRREFEGFQRGARAVLLGRDKHAFWAKGVLGAVAEVVRARPEHERAFETALGAGVQNLITETDADAKAAIEHLKKTGSGRATFLPLNLIRPHDFSAAERQEIGAAPGILGVALDLCEFAPRYRPALSSLLGRVVVAQDMDAALAFGRKTGLRYRTVTLDGEVLAAGGALTGGASGGKETGLLSREREREQLQALVETLGTERERLQAAHAAAGKERQVAEAALEQGRQAVTAAELQLSRAQAELASLAGEEKRLGESEAAAQREVATVQAQAEADAAGGEALSAEIAALEAEHGQQTATLAALQAALARTQSEAAAAGEQVGNLRVRRAALAEQETALAQRLQRLTADIAAMTEERSGKVAALERVQRHQTGAAAELASGEAQAAEARQDKAEREAELAALQARKLEIQGQANDCERELKVLRRQQAAAQQELQSSEVEETRLRLELENLTQRLYEHWGLVPAEVVGLELPAAEQPAARTRVGELRDRLRELGPVDLNAIAEYQNARERHGFLQQQRADLDEAKAGLHRAIAELDHRIQHHFLESFQTIRAEFSQVYRELFEGGSADLVLVDETDLLETGIEIIAQPPGKKPQPLSLLSGGERAMTACALVFSLLRVRPTPFVVLDEVEAALDEANVERVGRYLKSWSRGMQFVCITHQRPTMEVADALYGVTMEQAGISKIVSVRISDRPLERASGED